MSDMYGVLCSLCGASERCDAPVPGDPHGPLRATGSHGPDGEIIATIYAACASCRQQLDAIEAAGALRANTPILVREANQIGADPVAHAIAWFRRADAKARGERARHVRLVE